MDESILGIIYLVSVILSIVIIICFFVLCSNVAKLVKQTDSSYKDYNEYIIFEKMGEYEKAYYHLHRAFAIDQLKGIDDSEIYNYYQKFKKLGNIPNSKLFENYKEDK